MAELDVQNERPKAKKKKKRPQAGGLSPLWR